MKNLLPAILTVAMCATVNADDPTIDWDLKDALRQLDQQADNFDTAMAHIVVERSGGAGEGGREEGVMFINDDGDIRVSVESPEQRVYLMDNRDLYRYLPAQNLVEEYYLPKHPERLIPFVRLGFSTSGKDLDDDFLVSAIGERYIGDRRTLGFDLTPKRDKQRARVSGMQLWIDQASWMPVQQVIEATAGRETLTISYTHMARNLKLNPDLFKRNWPRGVEKKKIK